MCCFLQRVSGRLVINSKYLSDQLLVNEAALLLKALPLVLRHPESDHNLGCLFIAVIYFMSVVHDIVFYDSIVSYADASQQTSWYYSMKNVALKFNQLFFTTFVFVSIKIFWCFSLKFTLHYQLFVDDPADCTIIHCSSVQCYKRSRR